MNEVIKFYKYITKLYPYLKEIKNPKDFADCIEMEGKKRGVNYYEIFRSSNIPGTGDLQNKNKKLTLYNK